MAEFEAMHVRLEAGEEEDGGDEEWDKDAYEMLLRALLAWPEKLPPSVYGHLPEVRAYHQGVEDALPAHVAGCHSL